MSNEPLEPNQATTSLKKRLKNAKELPFLLLYILMSAVSAYFLSDEFSSHYVQCFFYSLGSCFGIGIFCLTFACVLYLIQSVSLSFYKDSQEKAIMSLKNTAFSLLVHVVLCMVVYSICAMVDAFLYK